MIQAQQPVAVLFVCLGNICRSPMAEGAFRHLVVEAGLQDHIEIDSAGTSGWHQGEPPDRRAQRTSAARGIDISAQASRTVRTEDFSRFDYILAMDHDNMNSLSRSMPQNASARLDLLLSFSSTDTEEVPDPYYGGEQGFDHCLDLILDGAAGLLRSIRR